MKKISLLLLLLSGCAVGPNYQRPDTVVSDTWSADATLETALPLDCWWEEFHEELLTKYITLAEQHNYDLKSAEAHILEARALKQIAASKLFPQIGFDLNGTKTYFSKNGPVFEIGQASGNVPDTTSTNTGLPFVLQIPQIQNLFNALFDASWELDFFGKTRRGLEAATAVYESLIEQKNSVLLSIRAEIARNYFDLRGAQEKERLLQKNIELSEQHAAITKRSLEFGYANELDMQRIEAELAYAKAALPDTQSEIAKAIYALSVLIGTMPETLESELRLIQPLPQRPNTLAVGIRSDLLRRRPDIRYAERKLAEATAEIGVAVASFFPTISLLSTGGFQSLVLPQLFEWGSKTWAYGTDVSMPVFQGGRLTGNLLLSRAHQAMEAAAYQKAVLSAFQDAENSLKQYQDNKAATEDYQKNVLHNTYVVAITRERHNKGLINAIDLINNEKQLISAELRALDSEIKALTALVAVYKSLGGNWDPPPVCIPEKGE